jgi:hypothetical protein
MKSFYHTLSKKAIIGSKMAKIKKSILKMPIFASRLNNI